MRRLTGLVVLLCALQAAARTDAADESGQGRAEAAGRELLGLPGPATVLTTIDGQRIVLADAYGKKPVYLKFWATWCVPCRQQMPGYERDYEELGDRVSFVAVNTGFNETEAAVQDYRRRMGLHMPIVMDDGTLASALNLRVTPQHVVIGRDGRILYVGHLADARLRDALQAALSEAEQSSTGRAITAAPVFTVGEKPRGLSAQTLDGATFQIAGSASRTRVLVFFSPWCESYLAKSRPAASRACRRVRQDMNRLAPRGDAQWLGVSSGLWASASDLRGYAKDPGTAIPLTLDSSGELFRAFDVHDVPTVILLDSQGRIVRKLGPNDSGLEAALRSIAPRSVSNGRRIARYSRS
jgi:thiol-disulfide isomerase/thioredoxin